jgi:four helix bundle protein
VQGVEREGRAVGDERGSGEGGAVVLAWYFYDACSRGAPPGRSRRVRAGDCSLALAVSLDPRPASTRGTRVALGFTAPERNDMLRIYQVILGLLEEMQPVVRRIEVKDKDLGRQLRRASCSVALNVAEGMYSRGRNREARYHTALGSARETLSCLEVAQRCRFVAGAEPALLAQLNQIIGTLVKLVAA